MFVIFYFLFFCRKC